MTNVIFIIQNRVSVGKKRFLTATNEIVERDRGYAILQVEGFETIDEIIFAEDRDMSLLGVKTIEGFGVMVDNIGQRFVETPSPVPANVIV